MNGYYDFNLVALSFAVAVLASYTALDLAGCVSADTSSPRKSWTWLITGAVSMGTGIWSMHFIGMLAFHLPVPVAYDLPISLLSMFIAIMVSAIALLILRRPQLGRLNLAVGAVLMGLGISAMHYTGMYAMKMFPPIRYDPLIFASSVLIATAASLAALWIGFQLRRGHSRLAIMAKIGSACVMAFAITGMHYTGMAAARFAPEAVCIGATSANISNMVLAIIIAGSTMGILSLTLIISALDAHFALNNAKLAAALKRITGELDQAQGELVRTARQVGRSEVANSVLHNVGNVLNSVNISASVIGVKLRNSKSSGLSKAVQLMNDHAADLGGFISADERGRALPGYLNNLVTALAEERSAVASELESLVKSVDHIKEIVARQQNHSGAATLVERVQVKDLLEEALRINADSIGRRRISIVKQFAEVPDLLLDKHRLLQILTNLIANADRATEGSDRSHQITLTMDVAAQNSRMRRLRICVGDDGEGIPPENLKRLFTHGFTTRANGNGFGLHSCALAVKEMMGTISASSEGRGRGAAFTLDLPMNEALSLI